MSDQNTLPQTGSKYEQFSEDQKVAWNKLVKWASDPTKLNFILRGYAGTGKTFLMQDVPNIPAVQNLYLTAPTNKATKVLSQMTRRPAKTTFSAFGLRMEQKDDELVLTRASVPPYFPRGAFVSVDEAGMAGSALVDEVLKAQKERALKLIWTGDPLQLTPVGEKRSPAWSVTKDPDCRAMLREVRRFDNQLLALSIKLRHCIKNKEWDSPLESDHDSDQGIWKFSRSSVFLDKLLNAFRDPTAVDRMRVLAWRNKTVNEYNDRIREVLGYKAPYVVGERILIAEPVQRQGVIVNHIDDEFTVTKVTDTYESLQGLKVPVWALDTGEGTYLSIPQDYSDVDGLLKDLANAAKSATPKERYKAWKFFWETKARFHKVRYAYSMTSHRAQGSTYQSVWVDQMDILANSTKREAFRSLYVCATRPTTRLYTY